ncbi:hypothetical protein FDP41_006339 [Naegleria fowleri]|uniref:Uncharacterized protein n=1 Tax=Naegleria fowleri TaxID=5763 RepID=A0A6A5BMR8_NAEFO|nr:uncharacterized protein FDP41_006339 [Naegleria fowleri]KAF0974865.1 hypothetical protein FDP41_006339 [Naegleria fowleri]CAG4711277.1 unnamed protein product [Naegleria fowleri]
MTSCHSDHSPEKKKKKQDFNTTRVSTQTEDRDNSKLLERICRYQCFVTYGAHEIFPIMDTSIMHIMYSQMLKTVVEQSSQQGKELDSSIFQINDLHGAALMVFLFQSEKREVQQMPPQHQLCQMVKWYEKRCLTVDQNYYYYSTQPGVSMSEINIITNKNQEGSSSNSTQVNLQSENINTTTPTTPINLERESNMLQMESEDAISVGYEEFEPLPYKYSFSKSFSSEQNHV